MPNSYEGGPFDGAEISGELVPEHSILDPDHKCESGDQTPDESQNVTAIYPIRGISQLPAGYDDLLDT